MSDEIGEHPSIIIRLTEPPQVEVAWDPGEVVFDDASTPMLTYGRHPEHGLGWTVSYVEDASETAGVAEYFIPGGPTDQDWAIEQARRWLDEAGDA